MTYQIAVAFLVACGHTQNQTPSAASVTQPISSEPARTQPQQQAPREPDKLAEPGADAAAEHGDTPPAAKGAPALASDSIESFMVEHFLITAWARDSVVDGELDVIRAPLLALAGYRYESVAPGGWMKGIAQLQAAARLTAQAQTLSAAASGIATMGHVCGQCHTEQGGPSVDHYSSEKKGPRSDGFDARMFRHAWAMERMWEGLTAPSDNAWQAGAAALAQAPVAVPKTRPALPPAVVQTLTLVRQLGVKAATAESADAREKVYGELLVTCADCHRHAPKLEY
jgi:mono/diheme cytochrome c family protein